MRVSKLQEMIKGWFIGNFEPSLYPTSSVEVAVKYYNAGDAEPMHHHKLATEYTVVAKGRIEMNGAEYGEGDIIVVEPNDATDFRCLEDGTINVVVKIPGASDDKYFGEAQ